MAIYVFPAQSVSLSPSSVKFVNNSVLTDVTSDSLAPANNSPLPTGLMIKKDDGNYYPVTLDTTNPYQHTPIPVAITDVTGTANVTITAGDIQVGIKHNGSDPSSVRIGDGTTLAAVTVANALKVDGSAVTQPVSGTITANLGTIDGVATSANQTNGNQITQIKSGSSGNIVDVKTLSSSPVGGDKAILTQAVLHGKHGSNYVDILANASNALIVDGSGVTQPISGSVTATVSGSVTANAGTNLNTSALALETTQTTQNTYIGSLTETAPATDTASSGLNGRLQRIAQRLTSLIAQLPASLGAKAGTGSLSVVPATDAVFSVVQSNPAAATISTIQLTVGVAAVRATVSGSAPSASRKKVWIKPSKNNTGAIYIGSSSVSISNGMEIIGPDRWEMLNDSNDYYLVSDTAAQVVEILEVV